MSETAMLAMKMFRAVNISWQQKCERKKNRAETKIKEKLQMQTQSKTFTLILLKLYLIHLTFKNSIVQFFKKEKNVIQTLPQRGMTPLIFKPHLKDVFYVQNTMTAIFFVPKFPSFFCLQDGIFNKPGVAGAVLQSPP